MRVIAILAVLLMAFSAAADDGPMFRRNVSKTPDLETEHAAIRMLPVYVPAQTSDGTLLTEGIEYYNADGESVETRLEARPLITHYNDGHVEFIEEEGYGGFPGHGHRDAWGAVSLDDGATWKQTNLSRSGDRSSIKIKDGKKRVPYPGDVGRSFAASDGNQVLIVWASKYCGSGSPAYAMSEEEQSLLASHLEETGTIADAAACTDSDLIGTPCIYLEDVFGVAGSQGLQSAADLAEDGYPLVGDYPYSCMWAARGVILPPAAEGEISTFVWFKAERLSSGVRSGNRPEAVCVKGAGCVVTWQEDPDGIRPGGGHGPGEGWSGAIAHHQTDTWYSFISWDDFALVSDDGTYGLFYDDTGALDAWVAANPTGSPKAAVPMSVPIRLTDNYMCKAEDDKPFCYADFDEIGTADFCAESVSVTIETPEGPTQEVDICITEDGRLMRGNTASTRARLGLHGYASDPECAYDKADPDACPIDSAWFYMAYEENKGLGDEGEDEDTPEDLIDKVDMGKNVWYHTFDMFKPELVSQGMMLNQPAVYPDDFTNPEGFLTPDSSQGGYNFYTIDPDPIYETQGGLDTTLYQSEIARRPSKISQDWYDAGLSGTVALQLWKQGIIRRGGPADIMARRFVMPPPGDGVCTTTYEERTTTYEECKTIYEECITEPGECTTEEVCTTETVCEENPPNPEYNYNPGQCKKNPDQPRCYQYIDPDGNYTNELLTCSEVENCEDVTTCENVTTCETVESCDVNNTGCTATETCGPVNWCDVSDDSCTATEIYGPVDWCNDIDDSCTATESCTSGVDDNLNPYDYTNMVCNTWAFTDGSNPRYVKGFCADPAINLSGNTISTSESCGDATGCLDAFPFNEYFDDLDMTDSDPISKIYTWEQIGPGSGDTITDPTLTNLDDLSWENPYDMAKGHRGFMAGDMIMAMYAWTPNWNDLTNGHSIVNLYVRRSFDGGQTWSTLPADFTHTDGVTYSGDGTTTCEWMGPISDQLPACTTYGAGDFEQARNVSQLLGSQVTVLDPRFSPTTRSITGASVSTDSLPLGFTAPLYDDDTRDPSRFFMVYETGHTSAYDAGEATPLDLFYSRAVDWGDDYMVLADTIADCVFSDDTLNFCNEFDAIEGSRFDESGEASVTCSPGGQFFYAVWNQWDFDLDGTETGADAWFRRILFLDDYIPGVD